MLLGHFKETRAHKLIVDIFSLPPDLPSQLFGDITTEDLPMILLNTCYGSVELIKSLIVNKEAYDFCRASSAEALAYAVLEGYVSRVETLTFLASLFTGAEAKKGSAFWGLLASTACDLYPAEIMDTIRKGYNDNIIDATLINLDDFERHMKQGKEKCLDSLKKNLEAKNLKDIHQTISWWANFKNKSEETSKPKFPSFLPDIPTSTKTDHKAQKKKSQAKKNKKKQFKASKKKNRGKKKKK